MAEREPAGKELGEPAEQRLISAGATRIEPLGANGADSNSISIFTPHVQQRRRIPP
ncbi:hypothetical protein ACQP1W_28120 [Spirillospora sp. CA-255316]